MKLTMVGTGYVGLVSGACFSNTGNDVHCLDVDGPKIALLNDGKCPIYEPGLAELMRRNSGRLVFTTDPDAAYAQAEIIFICVGTQAGPDGSPDLTFVMQAARDIAEAIDRVAPLPTPRLIVVKSTVPVGTCERVRDTIKSITKTPFYIASNPEFLKEGAAVSDFMRPDRVICGTESDEAAEILRDLYHPFVRQGNPIIQMDIRSSEMVKYAGNAMLATKISFINEIAILCEHFGADIAAVRQGICADHRIGRQFLHPGLGYGGSCFPKDIRAIIDMGRTVGFDMKLADAVHTVNEDQRGYFWRKITGHFGGDLNGRTLGFWGIAFKPETDDIREAPSLTLIQNAMAAGATVRAFDPVAAENLKREHPEITTTDDMYSVLDGCDALIICTEWSEFRQPDFARMAQAMRKPVIFDGRNIYRLATMQRAGFTYYSVGRDPLGAKTHRNAATMAPSTGA